MAARGARAAACDAGDRISQRRFASQAPRTWRMCFDKAFYKPGQRTAVDGRERNPAPTKFSVLVETKAHFLAWSRANRNALKRAVFSRMARWPAS